MLSLEELEKAGGACAALHKWYMKVVAVQQKVGFNAWIKREHFWHDEKNQPPVCVELGDLYDILNMEALDMSILRY